MKTSMLLYIRLAEDISTCLPKDELPKAVVKELTLGWSGKGQIRSSEFIQVFHSLLTDDDEQVHQINDASHASYVSQKLNNTGVVFESQPMRFICLINRVLKLRRFTEQQVDVW